jgi:hypothetical protein
MDVMQYLYVIVLLWLTMNALIWQPMAVLLAHYRRGRALEGALLGFTLGPIGVAIILLVLDDRRTLSASREEQQAAR